MSEGGLAYHGALSPLEEACATVGNIRWISNLLDVRRLRKPTILLRHIGFAVEEATSPRRPVFVRDFSNVPLWLVFPLLAAAKHNVFFLVNHNLQWTLESRLEKGAFCSLARRGCRFVFFEQVPEGLLRNYGIEPDRFCCLPHPVPETPFLRKRTGGVETIGIIGQYRPEKGIDELLTELEPLADAYRIMLALPNLDAFRSQSRFAGVPWLSFRDTSNHDRYRETIAECDAIILNHPVRGYEYRASGLIADASAARVPVVARNLPVLRHQICEPACIGEMFDKLAELPECLERVSEKLRCDAYDFSAYKTQRSGAALTRHLTEMFGQA